jgi:hypothetical protein
MAGLLEGRESTAPPESVKLGGAVVLWGMSENDKARLVGGLFLDQRRLDEDVRMLRVKLAQTANRLHELGRLIESVIEPGRSVPGAATSIASALGALELESISAVVAEFESKSARLAEVQKQLAEIA